MYLIIVLCLHPVRAIPLKKLHKKCLRYVDNVFIVVVFAYVQRSTRILSSNFDFVFQLWRKIRPKLGYKGTVH